MFLHTQKYDEQCNSRHNILPILNVRVIKILGIFFVCDTKHLMRDRPMLCVTLFQQKNYKSIEKWKIYKPDQGRIMLKIKNNSALSQSKCFDLGNQFYNLQSICSLHQNDQACKSSFFNQLLIFLQTASQLKVPITKIEKFSKF